MSRPAAVAAPKSAADPQLVLRALLRKSLVIALVTVNTTALAWLWTLIEPKRYRATAIAAVSPVVETIPDGEQIRSVQALDQRTIVATAAALVSTPAITKAAVARGEIGYELRAVVLPNTNLLRIEVEGADADRAATIANRVPALLGTQTRALFRYYGASVVSPAVGGELFFPRTDRTIAAGFVIGVFLGVLLIWAPPRIRRVALE
ncbi:MAG: hypothetical protein ACXW5U_00305 [Thermoanaerobaculia bacterium]